MLKPATNEVPLQVAVVFQPANVYPVFAKVPELLAKVVFALVPVAVVGLGAEPLVAPLAAYVIVEFHWAYRVVAAVTLIESPAS